MPPRYRTAGLGQGQTRRPQPADPFPNAQIQAGQALAKQASGLVSAVAGRLEKDARITARTQLAEFQGEAGMKYAEGVRTGDVSTPGFADRMLNWFDERFAEIRGDPEEMSPWDANAFDALAPGVAQMRANLGIQAASAEATEADKSEAFNLQTTMPNALAGSVKAGAVDVSDALGQFDAAIEDVNRPESEKLVWRKNGRQKIWDSHYRGEIDRDPALAVEQLKTEAAIQNLGPERSATLQSLAQATLARRKKETGLALREALISTDEARRDAVAALLNGTDKEQSDAQDVLDEREENLKAALAGSGLPESEKLKIWNGFIEDRQIEKASLYVRSSDTPLLAVKDIFDGKASIGGEDIRNGISSERLGAWQSRMLEEARAEGRAKRARIKLQEDIAEDTYNKNMNDFVKLVISGEADISDGAAWVEDGRLRATDYYTLSNQAAARKRSEESALAAAENLAYRRARQEAADAEAAEDKAYDDAYGALLARDVAGGGLDADEVRDAVRSGEVRPQDGKTLLDILSMKDRQAQQDALAMRREERARTGFDQGQRDRAARLAAEEEAAAKRGALGDLIRGVESGEMGASDVRKALVDGLIDPEKGRSLLGALATKGRRARQDAIATEGRRLAAEDRAARLARQEAADAEAAEDKAYDDAYGALLARLRVDEDLDAGDVRAAIASGEIRPTDGDALLKIMSIEDRQAQQDALAMRREERARTGFDQGQRDRAARLAAEEEAAAKRGALGDLIRGVESGEMGASDVRKALVDGLIDPEKGRSLLGALATKGRRARQDAIATEGRRLAAEDRAARLARQEAADAEAAEDKAYDDAYGALLARLRVDEDLDAGDVRAAIASGEIRPTDGDALLKIMSIEDRQKRQDGFAALSRGRTETMFDQGQRDRAARLAAEEEAAAKRGALGDLIRGLESGEMGASDVRKALVDGLIDPEKGRSLLGALATKGRRARQDAIATEGRRLAAEDRAARLARQEAADAEAAEDKAYDDAYGALLARLRVDEDLDAGDVRAAIASGEIRPTDGDALLKIMSIEDRQKQDDEVAAERLARARTGFQQRQEDREREEAFADGDQRAAELLVSGQLTSGAVEQMVYAGGLKPAVAIRYLDKLDAKDEKQAKEVAEIKEQMAMMAVMAGDIRRPDQVLKMGLPAAATRRIFAQLEAKEQDALAMRREERAATRFEQAQRDREVAAQYAAGLESANALLLSGDLTAGKLEEMVVAGKVKATAAIGLLDKLDAKDEKQAKEVAEIKEQMAMMAVMAGDIRRPDQVLKMGLPAAATRRIFAQLEAKEQDALAMRREERAATRFEQAQRDREVAAQYAAGLESANALLLSGDLTAGKLEEMVVAGKVKATAAIGLLDKLDAKDEKQAKEVAEIKEQMAMMAVMAGDIRRPDQVLKMGLPAAATRRILKELETKQDAATGNLEDLEFDRFLKWLHDGRLTADAVLKSRNLLSNEQKTFFLNEISERDEKQEEDRIDFIVEDTQNQIDEGGVSVEYVMGLDIPPGDKQDLLKHLDNQMKADENARALEFHQRLTAGEDPVAVRKSLDSAFLGGAIPREQYTDLLEHIDKVVGEDHESKGVTMPDARQQAVHYRSALRSLTGGDSSLLAKFQKTEANALRTDVMNHYNEMLVAGVPVKLAYVAGSRMWNKNRWILHDLSRVSKIREAVLQRRAEINKIEDISTIQIDMGPVMINAISPPAIVITDGLIDEDATRKRMVNQNNDGTLSDAQLLEIDRFLKDLP